jgi:hypothetical protein
MSRYGTLTPVLPVDAACSLLSIVMEVLVSVIQAALYHTAIVAMQLTLRMAPDTVSMHDLQMADEYRCLSYCCLLPLNDKLTYLLYTSVGRFCEQKGPPAAETSAFCEAVDVHTFCLNGGTCNPMFP